VKRAAVLLCLLAAACGDGPHPFLCDGGNCGGQVSWRKSYQQRVAPHMDILFVVDDTPAIAPHVDEVAAGVAGMAARLTAPSPVTALHVGFARAGACDASTRGAACGIAAPEQFMRWEWCGSTLNYSASFAGTFSCLGDLGAANCAPAQPLATALRVLRKPALPGWEGFLRDEAYLLVVVISAGDDASATAGAPTPIADLVAGLRALKSDPSQVLVSIIGPGGDCSGGEPSPPRLTEFVNNFGANGLSLPLCSGNLAVALDRAASWVNYSLEPVCASNVRDTDLETPGLQAGCTFEDRARQPDGSTAVTHLPNCNDSAPPCWRMTPGGLCGGGAGGAAGSYILSIQRAPGWCAEAGMDVTIECLGCANPNDPACVPAR
jgi:hypothetical protein